LPLLPGANGRPRGALGAIFPDSDMRFSYEFLVKIGAAPEGRPAASCAREFLALQLWAKGFRRPSSTLAILLFGLRL
jgi:hypothetical protein